MFAAAFHTSRHYILLTVMACLCVLLGGPSYAAGAESLIIAGATYYEPGVSGPGWVWTDADHLELNGYAGEAIGADPKRACAFMVCVCRTQVLAMARPAVGFLSMPRGLLQPVPMATLLAWAGRLCPRDL